MTQGQSGSDARFAPFYCMRASEHELHRHHHDHEHGRSPADDAGYLERLAWEILQPGLSWRLILQKRQSLRRAFEQFDPVRVSAFDDARLATLLEDRGVIRHRQKLSAIIENARIMVGIAGRDGSFEGWLERMHRQRDMSLEMALIRQFRFVGPSVAREFLVGAGVIEGAHHPECPIFPLIIESEPLWIRRCSPPAKVW